MARYIIEFRFHGYAKKFLKQTIYEVGIKFRVRGVSELPRAEARGVMNTQLE